MGSQPYKFLSYFFWSLALVLLGTVWNPAESNGFTFNVGTFWKPATPPACGGYYYKGACWYVSAFNQSCDGLCADKGGYNTATRDIAGSAGNLADCQALLVQLVGAGANPGDDPAGSVGIGCAYHAGIPLASGFNSIRVTNIVTNGSALMSNKMRACACNE